MNLDLCYRDPFTHAPSKPLPWQEAFHGEREAKGRLAGGAFGAGKSLTLVHDAIGTATEYPGTRVAIVRKVLKDLKASTMRVFFHDVFGCTVQDIRQHPLIRYWNATDNFLRFTNSSEIWFMQAGSSGGGRIAAGVRSQEFGAVYFDEIVEMTEDEFREWTARLRHPKGPNRWAAATNPSPNWVKQRFHPSSTHRLPGVAFFQTRTADNVHLPAGYERDLRATYPDTWVRRYLDGSWDVFEGQIFTEFDERTHVQPFDVPRPDGRTWKELSCLDWGFTNPTAWLAVGIDPNGHLLVWKEHYQAGWRPAQHAAVLVPILQDRSIRLNLADPSCWRKERDGNSVADEFRQSGMILIQADNDVTGGIQAMKKRMHEKMLTIHPGCRHLISEIMGYQWKDLTPGREAYANDPEEPVKKDDHAVDALRYIENWTRIGGPLMPKIRRPDALADEYMKSLVRKRRTSNIRA